VSKLGQRREREIMFKKGIDRKDKRKRKEMSSNVCRGGSGLGVNYIGFGV
jgi:hypothetical protein